MPIHLPEYEGGKIWVTVYVNGHEKHVGTINDAGDIFTKHVQEKNLKDIPPGICFDDVSIDEVEAYGCKTVHIYVPETQKDYYASIATIRKYGFQCPGGWPGQTILIMEHWVGDANQLTFDI